MSAFLNVFTSLTTGCKKQKQKYRIIRKPNEGKKKREWLEKMGDAAISNSAALKMVPQPLLLQTDGEMHQLLFVLLSTNTVQQMETNLLNESWLLFCKITFLKYFNIKFDKVNLQRAPFIYIQDFTFKIKLVCHFYEKNSLWIYIDKVAGIIEIVKLYWLSWHFDCINEKVLLRTILNIYGRSFLFSLLLKQFVYFHFSDEKGKLRVQSNNL